jgi:hypothetical protein
MEEKKIEIITRNSDGLYNKVTVHKLEDGSLSKTGDEIAEILLEGDKDSIDTSDFTELDLADGHEYGKIFVNIPEEHEDFDIVKDAADDAGSYLDEMESPLSKEDEEDRDSFIENLTKDSDTKYSNGIVYDPDSGNTYKCKMWFDKNDVLKIRGYIGFSLLGRTVEFTKVTGPNPESQQEGEPIKVHLPVK